MTIATRNRGNFPLVETMGQVWGVSGQQKMIVGNIKMATILCCPFVQECCAEFFGSSFKKNCQTSLLRRAINTKPMGRAISSKTLTPVFERTLPTNGH